MIQFGTDSGTSRSCLWIFLSLLCAAAFQQTTGSEKGVSLKCSETVEVEVGQNVTLKCNIKYNLDDECRGCEYNWSNSKSEICNSHLKNNICEWDKQTYVSLTILNVKKQENYTVTIRTSCGSDEESIVVQVFIREPEDEPTEEQANKQQPEQRTNTPIILGVFATLIVIAVIVYLIVKQKKKQNQTLFRRSREHLASF